MLPFQLGLRLDLVGAAWQVFTYISAGGGGYMELIALRGVTAAALIPVSQQVFLAFRVLEAQRFPQLCCKDKDEKVSLLSKEP